MDSTPLKPLFIDSDANLVETLISSMKSLGYAIRPLSVSTEEELYDQLKNSKPDLIIASPDRLTFPLSTITQSIEKAGRRIPLIVLLDEPPPDISSYLEEGIEDVIATNNRTHFQHVIRRTANAVFTWRKLKEAEASLLEAEKRCHTLLESSKDAIAYISGGMHVFANKSYLQAFDFADLDEIQGTPLLDLVSRSDREKIKTFMRDYERNAQSGQSLQAKLMTFDGQEFDAELDFSPAIVEGEPCTQIIVRPQENAKEYEERINYLSQHDLLTGLYNRQYFIDKLKETTLNAARGKQNGALLQISLDRFNQLTETFGISGGDLIQADFGKLLNDFLPEGDIACRFEKNKFMVLSHVWEQDELQKVMDTFIESSSAHLYEIDGHSVSTTISIGAAIIDENTPEPDELILRAERASKKAFSAGGGRAFIYLPREGEMTQKQLDEAWGKRLISAIEEGRLRLLFQPIVSLQGEPSHQYNVFMRMLDERGRPVAAREFMPSAERTGTAKILDRWVVSNAINELTKHVPQDKQLKLFIKLTAGTLQDPQILPWLAEEIKNTRLSGEHLIFEIKTDTAVNYLRQTREFLKGIHQLRSRLVLDGFGSVANPFQLLKQVPAEFIKLDASLMDNLADNPENQETIQNITEKAHAEGRLVIAQKVENPSDMSLLWGMGVNYVQGNFLQIPSEKLDYDFSVIS